MTMRDALPAWSSSPRWRAAKRSMPWSRTSSYELWQQESNRQHLRSSVAGTRRIRPLSDDHRIPPSPHVTPEIAALARVIGREETMASSECPAIGRRTVSEPIRATAGNGSDSRAILRRLKLSIPPRCGTKRYCPGRAERDDQVVWKCHCGWRFPRRGGCCQKKSPTPSETTSGLNIPGSDLLSHRVALQYHRR